MKPASDVRQDRLRDLMIAAQHGDSRAYREFLHELTPFLRGWFRRRLHSAPDDVEDLLQETLLAVHNNRHTYDPDQALGGWVYAIAGYKLVDLLRSRAARELLHEPLDDEGSELLSDAEPAAAEARRDLGLLLQRLPDKQRLPIQMVKIEGLSVTETSRRTGLSESAVKIGIHRGLKALAALIRDSR